MFKIIDQSNWMVIQPTGDIVSRESEDFRRLLLDLLNNGHKRIRFDLSKVRDIDAAALRVFVVFSDLIGRRFPDRRIELIHTDPDIEILFRLTRLDRTYRIA
ncbi:MAG: STAS domain-containing protein [Thermodesulfobacteriota bacterium]